MRPFRQEAMRWRRQEPHAREHIDRTPVVVVRQGAFRRLDHPPLQGFLLLRMQILLPDKAERIRLCQFDGKLGRE